MKIYRPIKSAFRSQSFGDNRACAKTDVSGRPYQPWQIVSANEAGICPIGYKKFYPLIGLKGHNGFDLGSYRTEPVHFSVDGEGETEWEVWSVIDDPGYGLTVEVYSTEAVTLPELPAETGPEARAAWERQGGTLHVKFLYVHALDNLVADEQKITIGEQIQLADSTGASSGDHVHFSMKFCDAEGRTFDTGNGFKGAVDHSIYYYDQFVLDFLGLRQHLTLLQQLVSALQLLVTLLNRLKNKTGEVVGGLLEKL